MKTISIVTFFLGLMLCLPPAFTQDTFSIVAVDPVTGQVGSAGASCIDASAIAGGVSIIGRLYPGRGAINTQSYWYSVNQNNAGVLMNSGNSPAEIITWLEANDAQSNAGIRQYGIVDFDPSGNPRSAGFTGADCFDYKNHITGPNYAIQGNILLGQEVLDSMEARFLNTEGELAVKLMAALQGAKMPGADTRCADEGISSLSSYIRVANPTDVAGTYYLDLTIPQTPFLIDPIDLLQNQFDTWLSTVSTNTDALEPTVKTRVQPNPFTDFTVLHSIGLNDSSIPAQLLLYNILGVLVCTVTVENASTILLSSKTLNHQAGIYFYHLYQNQAIVSSGKLILL